MMDYCVSARQKQSWHKIETFLEQRYATLLNSGYIRSVFGFAEFTPLYGGRPFTNPELSERDLAWLYDNGIGFRIPLTNLLIQHDDYTAAKPFLRKHHRKGNSVIVIQNRLAEWIRNDYPDYTIEASVIRGLDTVEKVMDVLPFFDTIVPYPGAFARDFVALDALPREKIRLFIHAGCMFSCKNRICYGANSRRNMGKSMANVKPCSNPEADSNPYTFNLMEHKFDVDRYKEMGFFRFKAMSFNPLFPAR